MSQVISLRLPDDTAQRLKESAKRAGRSVHEVGIRSIEEWLRQNEFAEIEFRAFYGGRRLACLRGALPVWELVMIAQDHDMDTERIAAYFKWPVWRVQAALNYYAAYPEEIDEVIESNRSMTAEKLQRLLPELEVYEVPSSTSTDEPKP